MCSQTSIATRLDFSCIKGMDLFSASWGGRHASQLNLQLRHPMRLHASTVLSLPPTVADCLCDPLAIAVPRDKLLRDGALHRVGIF